ncbi:MAG TPA: hypothetical protein PL100_02000 [Bacillota bacterium]|jgi:hypothetical protein|nr:hypothetical protein [Bacillota bacterium]HQC48287.1 hypothetical protein [Bacillota bacterium]
MELQHRLVRQAIDIAISKAIDDMKSDAKRSLRNLIDLGLFFSKGENQINFLNTAKEVISNPTNPYHSLIARMVADINNETIKKAGLNFGYSSLIYGANKLRKRREVFADPLPWLLIFNVYESSSETFDLMKKIIAVGRKSGIYSYIVCPNKPQDVEAVCEVAQSFDDCLFVMSLSSEQISEHSAEIVGNTINMIVSVKVSGSEFCNKKDENTFHMLKKNHCLFGFQISYNDSNIEQVAVAEYIDSAVNCGNTFGVFIADEVASEKCQAAMYKFACEVRGVNGQALIAIEWIQDMQYVSERILSGDGYMQMDLAEAACNKYKEARDTVLPIFL